MANAGRGPQATDIRVKEVAFDYEDYHYRTPIKFGGAALDRATILNVLVAAETESGRLARGRGSMPLGNVWSFPSRLLSYDTTLLAMKVLAEELAKLFAEPRPPCHPIDLFHDLEPRLAPLAAQTTARLALAEPIPLLCALVAASPFDAAVHDAFGKAHGLNCYRTYGPDFLRHDLEHYLGKAFRGETLDRYLRRSPCPELPLYHLVGALDPLEPAEVPRPIGDGLPETLGEWIRRDGLTHLKIKLNGDNLEWDVARVLRVDRVAEEERTKRGPAAGGCYSLDFNERCPNVGYLLEFLERIERERPAAYARIQYVEQPTARDLRANRGNRMHEASRRRPIVIDESLVDRESLELARDLGYTGAALKACKGQSASLLLAAAAQKEKMFLCVQDLTCPGASLIHSAGLAAHVPGVAAIEANARQYMPAANLPWEDRFPGLFRVRDGLIRTAELTGPGLGA